DAALYAQLMAQSQHGPPLAAIVRQALVDYMARQTEQVTSTVSLTETVADLAARVETLEGHIAHLAARLETLTANPQPAMADTAPVAASDQPPAADMAAETPAPRRGGRPSSPLRQQILTLLRDHPAGLRAEEIRVYVQARRPIGDTLQGMLKGGVL